MKLQQPRCENFTPQNEASLVGCPRLQLLPHMQGLYSRDVITNTEIDRQTDRQYSSWQRGEFGCQLERTGTGQRFRDAGRRDWTVDASTG